MIKSLLKSVFEKVSRQKVKCTVHSLNRQKFGEVAKDTQRCCFICFIELTTQSK